MRTPRPNHHLLASKLAFVGPRAIGPDSHRSADFQKSAAAREASCGASSANVATPSCRVPVTKKYVVKCSLKNLVRAAFVFVAQADGSPSATVVDILVCLSGLVLGIFLRKAALHQVGQGIHSLLCVRALRFQS
jgi:hypothetical protein